MQLCWAQKLHITVIFVLFLTALSSLLSGCGRKGDLYWPAPEKPIQQTPAKQESQTP